MATHEELVAEMPSLERLSVQDRLKLARKRRAQQLKRWTASDKEFTKRSRKSTVGKTGPESPKKRMVNFAHNIQLLEAAARGDIDEVRLLLESGVDPNIGNEDGLTALHQCCIDNNEAMMKLLVEHNADVNVTDRELWTPLHASSTCGHVNLARFLVTNGAELLAINSDGNMPYDICEDEVTLDYIESQMAERGVTQEQIDELREVAPNRMLAELIDVKNTTGDLECRDDVGATYLHIAAANGYDKVAKFLLDNNVDVNAKDNDGWQPIHAAACWAHGEMIQLVVQYGADLDAKTNNEETPLTICEDEDLKTLINQLKAEMHAHRSLENRLVRRNSSRNKRSSSIRRSSKREKGEMRKLDAKGEAMFIQSQVSTDEIPATNIDEVSIDTEEPPQSPTSAGSVSLDEAEPEEGEVGEMNGALETDIVPMPVIKEETSDSPERRATLENGEDAAVVQNGGGGDGKTQTGLAVSGLLRQPKSILKKRKEQDVVEDPNIKKSRKEKQSVRKQEQEEERQKEREEREKAKQLEREEKQRKKEEREREKQRLKEEKKQQRKREKEEREQEKQLKHKSVTEETENKTEEDPKKEEEDQDKNHTGNKETLAELKRQRASEHAKRTLSGDSTDEFESAWSEGRKDSFDILKDHQSQNSTKKKSPHIARKLFPHRPASGSYSFTEASSGDSHHRDSTGSEQNGVGDQGGLNTSDVSKTSPEPYPGDPPLKRFTAVGPEVIGGDDERRCCIIL